MNIHCKSLTYSLVGLRRKLLNFLYPDFLLGERVVSPSFFKRSLKKRPTSDVPRLCFVFCLRCILADFGLDITVT